MRYFSKKANPITFNTNYSRNGQGLHQCRWYEIVIACLSTCKWDNTIQADKPWYMYSYYIAWYSPTFPAVVEVIWIWHLKSLVVSLLYKPVIFKSISYYFNKGQVKYVGRIKHILCIMIPHLEHAIQIYHNLREHLIFLYLSHMLKKLI